MKILGVMADLFFLVKILDEAKKLGLGAEFVKDRTLAMEKIRALPPLVIFDLNFAQADPLGLIREMKSDPATQGIPAVAFVPHVQVELKQQALDAGCDVVVARSTFAQDLTALLAPYANARS
jgi:CheY-like chemotaxis protein